MLLIKVEPLRTMLTPASSTTAAMPSTYSSGLADSGGLSATSGAIKPSDRAHGAADSVSPHKATKDRHMR
jgi:hypothetical protein